MTCSHDRLGLPDRGDGGAEPGHADSITSL
jgi:hypothetical protein